MPDDAVLYELDGHVATITYNRPEALNAINGEMRRGLNAAFDRFRDEEDAWVAIVTGAGRAFCAGADMRDGAGAAGEFGGTFWEKPTINSFESGWEIFKPVIAAVNGYCLGYGLTLVTWCDFVIASERAEFGFPEVGHRRADDRRARSGCPQRINWQYAMELLLTGERIDADARQGDRARGLGRAARRAHERSAQRSPTGSCAPRRSRPRATKEVAVRSQHLTDARRDPVRRDDAPGRRARPTTRPKAGARSAKAGRRAGPRRNGARNREPRAAVRPSSMTATSSSSHDASDALERAARSSTARPVEHNLLLTILEQSIEHALGGTFWLVVDGADVDRLRVGVAAGAWARCSRRCRRARAGCSPSRSPRRSRACRAKRATAAAFAGRWTECHAHRGHRDRRAAALRAHDLTAGRDRAGIAPARGRRRSSDARSSGRDAFVDELDVVPAERRSEPSTARIAREQFWVWDDDGVGVDGERVRRRPRASRACSTCTRRPTRRGAGYATACVEHDEPRARSIAACGASLYTDLGNPTSNAIYRRIGYEAVAEILGYDFA